MVVFSEIRQDTPRLVVMFKRDDDGRELFQWGMVGVIPMMSLIGAVVRTQAELFLKDRVWHKECPELALVIVWDEARRVFDWFIHPDIPIDPLVGMLETIKATLTATHMARAAAAQQVQILGPDGRPFGR